MTPLSELADAARSAVEELVSGRWTWFASLSDLEQVQWRYCHAECDNFAVTLSAITGWAVVGVTNPTRGPIHRLVMTPEGCMLDAKGWVSLEDLRIRYKLKRLHIQTEAPWSNPTIARDEDFVPIIEALLQFPVSPFCEPEFKAKVLAFSKSLDAPRLARFSELSFA